LLLADGPRVDEDAVAVVFWRAISQRAAAGLLIHGW
jgi:hypothetical protein